MFLSTATFSYVYQGPPFDPGVESSLHRALGLLHPLCGTGRDTALGYGCRGWLWAPGAGDGGGCQTEGPKAYRGSGPLPVEGKLTAAATPG